MDPGPPPWPRLGTETYATKVYPDPLYAMCNLFHQVTGTGRWAFGVQRGNGPEKLFVIRSLADDDSAMNVPDAVREYFGLPKVRTAGQFCVGEDGRIIYPPENSVPYLAGIARETGMGAGAVIAKILEAYAGANL